MQFLERKLTFSRGEALDLCTYYITETFFFVFWVRLKMLKGKWKIHAHGGYQSYYETGEKLLSWFKKKKKRIITFSLLVRNVVFEKRNVNSMNERKKTKTKVEKGLRSFF